MPALFFVIPDAERWPPADSPPKDQHRLTTILKEIKKKRCTVGCFIFAPNQFIFGKPIASYVIK